MIRIVETLNASLKAIYIFKVVPYQDKPLNEFHIDTTEYSFILYIIEQHMQYIALSELVYFI